MTKRLSGISVFFPCYTDAHSIAEMVRRVNAVLPTVADQYAITVIDDGSSDHSVQVLQALQPEVPCLRIVQHGVNRGYGGALRSGFEAATHEFVFYTDGDGQYDPGDLSRMVPLMREGIGLVNGYKLNRADAFYRKLTGGTYEWLARRVFGARIKDVDCDFRLIRTDYLRRVPLTFESGAIGLELVLNFQRAGCRMAEVGVPHYPRLHGRSEFFSVRHVVNLISDVLRLWWHLRRPGSPARRAANTGARPPLTPHGPDGSRRIPAVQSERESVP